MVISHNTEVQTLVIKLKQAEQKCSHKGKASSKALKSGQHKNTDQMPQNTWNVTTNMTNQALITFNSGRLVIKTPVDQGMHDQAGGLDKNYVLDPQIWTL